MNREAFEAWLKSRSLDNSQKLDAWGRLIYKHTHIQAMHEAWQAALAHANVNEQSQPQQPSEEFKSAALQELYNFQEATGCDVAAELKQHQLAQAQQESRWISVDERLPEENCHVLVACEGGNVAATFYAIDHSFFDHAHGHKLSRKKHGKYSKHFELARQYGYRITHWMPLPPAPEGE